MVSYYNPPAGPVFHVDAPDSAISDVSLDNSMEDFASDIQVTGDGEGVDTLHRAWWMGDAANDMVASTTHISRSDVDEGDDLADIADGLRDELRYSDVNLTCKVALGGDVSPLDFTVGGQITLRFGDDPHLDPDQQQHRIMPEEITTTVLGFTPDGPNGLNLELAPMDGYTGWAREPEKINHRNLRTSGMGTLMQRLARVETRVTNPVRGQAATSSQEAH